MGYYRKHQWPHRGLIFGHMCFLVAYFLNLCTVSPLVHADTIRQVTQAKPSATHHCSAPGMTASPPTSSEPQQPPEPFCCEVRGAHNKAISSGSPQAADSPRIVDMILLPSLEGQTGKPSRQFFVQAPYPSSFPPRYLFFAVLLI